MFEVEDDIDVDDEFLNIVFENEDSVRPNVTTETLESHSELHEFSTARNSAKYTIDQPPRSCSDSVDVSCNFNSNYTSNQLRNTIQANRNIQPGANYVGNKENKRKQVSPPPSKSKRERKFPGPAGLLPDRKSSRGTPLKLDYIPEVESSPISTPDELCSQGCLSGSVLEDEPWQNLVADLGPDRHILEVVNVASVKRKAAARCFLGRKVPFLAAVLHHLDVSSPDPCIILRDSSGEIHGTLHREVWEQFAAELVVGSVLVIRNVGLLSTGISARRHYLNITANNLATIYSANPDKLQKRALHTLTSQDIVNTIEHWRSLVPPPRTTGSPVSVGSPALFSSSLSSPSSTSPAETPLHNIRPRLDSPRYLNTHQAVNMRPTLQNSRGIGRFPNTPQYSRFTASKTAAGKNLLPAFTNSDNSNPTHRFNSVVGCNVQSNPRTSYHNARHVKPISGGNCRNSSLNPQSLNNVGQEQNIETVKGVTNNNFVFNPVMVKSKCFSSKINTNNHRRDCENNLGNGSPRIQLSQSSQLTMEEQSVVESVLDGIDADSLFDDDF